MGPEFKSKFPAVLLVAALPLVSGCTNTITTIADDRTGEQKVADNEIILNINKRLLSEQYRDLFFNVSTDAFEALVMLTGTVKKQADKLRASKLVNGVTGIRTLYNEIQVTQEGGFSAGANDVWIDTKIKAQLVAAENVRSINYRWRVVNGTVYLLGQAQSAAEKAKVLKIIRETGRVKGIVQRVAGG